MSSSSSSSRDGSQLDDEKIRDETSEKTHSILDACKRGDLDSLRELAISPGGFLTDANRCEAWPILLGGQSSLDTHSRSGPEDRAVPWAELPRHRDEDQVRLDVDRSFVYYPNDNTAEELEEKKSALSDLITETLRRQPWLCYFQGYHDICQVFLLVLSPALRTSAVARLSGLRIRDFMLPNLAPAVIQLKLIPDILNAVDQPLCRHLSRIEPYFALSDTLTMFAHNIQRYKDISRLFDALLAREQVFSLYIFVQVVLSRRKELLEQDEPDMLHFTLSKLPRDLDLESIITTAAVMFDKHPPESLRSWRSISNASVLKTTRGSRSCIDQSLEDGHAFFNKQLKELEWDKRIEAMRKYDTWQNRAAVVTVLVGVTAVVYARKGGAPSGLMALTQWMATASEGYV